MTRHSKVTGRAPVFRPYLTVMLAASCLALLTAQHSLSAGQQGQPPATVHEDFDTLDRWENFYFPKIKEHTAYFLSQEDGVNFLVANSSGSASALMLRRELDVYETPVLRWRWRISNIYKKGDISTKSGDDSPMRVYVMFEYEPEHAPAGMRVKYALAKMFYGQYPPHGSLNYLWASRARKGSVLESAYTSRSRMLVLRSGPAETGHWMTEEVNILEDYRRAFGEDPPRRARLAVMNDSDNTGEAAVAHMDYLEILMPGQ